MRTTLYYTVDSNGDGSASVTFFRTKRLLDWHMENPGEYDERLCDSEGSVVVESSGPAFVGEAHTPFSYMLERFVWEDGPEGVKMFEKAFEDVLALDEYEYEYEPNPLPSSQWGNVRVTHKGDQIAYSFMEKAKYLDLADDPRKFFGLE